MTAFRRRMHVAQQCLPCMKQMGHGFLTTLFISVWDSPDFYIHCGFEVKKLVEMLTPDPIFILFQPIVQEGKEGGVSAQKKENIKYLPVSVGICGGLSQHVLMCKLAKKCT